MKSSSLVGLLTVLWVASVFAQANLYDHLYWDAKGNRSNQLRGMSGLSYLGRLNDTIPHAVAIGEITGSFNGDVRRGISSVIFNRYPGDTVRQFELPGSQVWRCTLNDDSFPDYVCLGHQPNGGNWIFSVLYGTAKPGVFDTAFVLDTLLGGPMVVTRCDSDRYDDIVLADGF